MKVIIVGGGIGGLTLGNALERANIDFVLLEARPILDPQVGASIAMGPGSMRVFDQFGAAEEIQSQTEPLRRIKDHNADGTPIAPPNNTPRLLDARLGYATCFLDRQLVLRALMHTIKQQDKLLLNKRITAVGHTDDGVTVHCEDGTSYDGDLVVGCDGVHSKIRAEMWRLGSKVDPVHFPEKEKTKMTAEYNCLFGISNPVPGLTVGDLDYTYVKDKSFLVFTGMGGRVYWFFFQKLDRKYHFHEREFPRYTKADGERVAEEHGWRKCHETVTLADLWKHRVSFSLVAMEEALFDKWSWGRMATIGDNAHKMTANHGQAGQNAVESAIALANELKRISHNNKLPLSTIRSALVAWQKKRQDRINATWQAAADVCRMQTLATVKDWVIVYMVMPNAVALLVSMITDSVIGAEVLEFLPFPEASLNGSCPFNPRAGVGFKESLGERALQALPLLCVAAGVAYLKAGAGSSENLSSLITTGALLDRPQATSFVMDAGLVYSIWLIEASRRGNALTLAQLSTFWSVLSQYIGAGTIAPTYYFFHYTTSSLEKYAPKDLRLTSVAYTRTVLPILLALVYGPWLSGQTFEPSNMVSWIWYSIPIAIAIVQYVLVKTNISPDTELEDAVNNITRDLNHIRACVGTLTAISAVQWWRFVWSGALKQLITSPLSPSEHVQSVLRFDHLGLVISSLVWIGLLISDTRSRKMDTSSITKTIVAGIVSIIVGGPSATVGMGWLWREQTLATKHDQYAITRRHSGKTLNDVNAEMGRDV